MNKEKVKELINTKKNVNLNFFYRGPRNQNESFKGKIIKVFPSIFLIKTDDNLIKSFSYNDFIIGNLKIITK